jgi:hypothetical protein
MSVEQMLLPTQRQTASRVNPKKMFLFSHTKVGKTTAISMLPNNLHIDLEDGSGFVDGLIINVVEQHKKTGLSYLAILGNIVTQIEEANKKNGSPVYKYITIDTSTALESVARLYATKLYKESPMGKNFNGKDVVTELPNGAGYGWLRTAFDAIYSKFDGLASECLIVLGHVKVASINKDGKDLQARDIELTGKLKGMICADVDAIGYIYRSKEDPTKTIVSFKTDETDLATGARPEHLRQQEFVLLEQNPDKTFTSHWDKIFI